MEPTILLLINGFFLAFVLLVLLIMFALQITKRKPDKIKVRDDLKKIKEQIEEN